MDPKTEGNLTNLKYKGATITIDEQKIFTRKGKTVEGVMAHEFQHNVDVAEDVKKMFLDQEAEESLDWEDRPSEQRAEATRKQVEQTIKNNMFKDIKLR